MNRGSRMHHHLAIALVGLGLILTNAHMPVKPERATAPARASISGPALTPLVQRAAHIEAAVASATAEHHVVATLTGVDAGTHDAATDTEAAPAEAVAAGAPSDAAESSHRAW
jgi:hypothetical protein